MNKYYRRRRGFDFSNFEVTKREILASITILAVMLLIGFLIGGKISEYQMDKDSEYNKAVKITSTDMFKYGMSTNVGNAFIYGGLEAVDTVSYPEIKGEYLYIEKVKERYTSHTRTVSTGSGKTRSTRVETYWTWDRVGSESIHSKNIEFASIEFDYCKIKSPDTDYIDTVKESSHIRYKYYGCKTKYIGTIYTKLKNNTISDNSSFYNNMTVDETVDYLESGVGLILFWIFWIILTIGSIFAFYYFDNNWLE